MRTMQASVYGKCIVADYNSVHKDKCLTEFLRLKNCYLVSIPVFKNNADVVKLTAHLGCSKA